MADDRALRGALRDLRDAALARSRLLASDKPAAMDADRQRSLQEVGRALDAHAERVLAAASDPARLSEERAVLYAVVSTSRMMSETAYTSRAEHLVTARYDAAIRQLRALRRQRRKAALATPASPARCPNTAQDRADHDPAQPGHPSA
ncbi:MAG: hypothetical protein WBA46_13600 [Thermomicrobiales bacterium]